MRSSKLLIPIVLGVVAVGAFWFLALAPKREEAKKIEADITKKQTELDQQTALLDTYKAAKDRYEQNYRTLARLGKAVPADDDVRSLLVQLSDAADRSKVSFDAITVGSGGATPPADGAAAATGSLAAAPGTVPVGSAGFSAMPFSFGFQGNFFRLSNFFNRLEDFVTVENEKIGVTGRLLLVGSISVTPDQNMNNLTARVGAASYIVPELTGVDGAAPVSTPGAAGAVTTPPATDAAASTPTIPTATIAGVR